jgi:signal transduction histidine kinase/CheY-like chemotaxis protein/HPt (histidine-containing phosphotransfer) domain-containing protein
LLTVLSNASFTFANLTFYFYLYAMNGFLTKQLEQISHIISGLKGEEADLEKMTELSQLLELLSHQIKTSNLEGFPVEKDIPDHGISQDAAFYFNNQFQIFRLAGEYEKILGPFDKMELLEVSSLFTSSGFELFREKTQELMRTGEPQSFLSEIISKNELLLPVHILLEKIRIGSKLEAMSGSLIFSNQKPSELENYREILIEHIPGMDVFLFDPSFRYVLAGGREKERMGFSNTDFVGKKLFEVYDEKVTKRLYPFYRNALDGIESEGEVRINKRVYFIHSTPVFGLNRQVVGGALISQDVTTEKEIEKNLIKAKKEAEESNNAKSIFLANMSHEIRTPLTAIVGFSDLLNKTKLTPEQKKFCGLISESAQHLLSVVNEILFLFKFGMGNVHIDKVPFKIHELVQNVHESLLLKAQEKDLLFQVSFGENVNELLIGDPFRIKQILINLAGNAIKFTEKGKVSIHINCEKQTKNEIHLRLEVADTGIGIHKEELNTIFNEFTRSSLANKHNIKGTGLGLTIVKKLVELLNGRLHVESIPGKGSRFAVVIPFGNPQGMEDVIPDRKYELDYNLLKGKKIFYADDDINNILLGETVFKRWEADYELAHDGREALDMLRKKQFDIILLDIRMPELLGTEVVQAIRKDENNPNVQTKIFAVTANIMESDILNYMKSGFDGYILKPFGEEYLYNKICNMLKIKIVREEQPAVGIDAAVPGDDIFFDTSLLMKTTAGNPNFFNKMIDTFITNAKESCNRFRNLKETGNWLEIGEQAHKAIPSFSYFGLNDIVNNLKKMEDLTLRQNNFNSVEDITDNTIFQIEKVIQLAENSKIKGQ